MIKAQVKQTGVHKWKAAKYLKPVDVSFIISLTVEVFFLMFSVPVTLMWLIFFLLEGLELKTLILITLVDIFWVWSIINTCLKKHREKKEAKSSGFDGFVRDYTINDLGIVCDYSSDDEWGSFMQGYGGIISAAETKEHFAFRVSEDKAYIIEKSEITEGSSQELSELLSRKLGSRFRRKM